MNRVPFHGGPGMTARVDEPGEPDRGGRVAWRRVVRWGVVWSAWAGACVALSGCAVGSRAWMGGSLAKRRLYQVAQEKVLAMDAAAAPGCEDRFVASVRVLDRPAAAATDYDRLYTAALPDVSRGVQTPSAQPSSAAMIPVAFTERWIVERCGTRAAYRVTFSPGDAVEVVPEPQPHRPPKP